MLQIAIDAMGGDFGHEPIVEGTIQALLTSKKPFEAILVGDENILSPLIPQNLKKRVRFVQATDVIDMHDSATDALKRKDSTIYKAVELVRNKEAHAVVSAGHSGATMSLATLDRKSVV